jgi:error-prone DNA polymerase
MAVTDVNTLAGVVRAHAAAKQVKGFVSSLVRGSTHRRARPARVGYGPGRVRPAVPAADARLSGGTEKVECLLSLEDFLAHSEGMLAALDPGAGGTEARRHGGTKSRTDISDPGSTSCLRAFVPPCLDLLRLLRDALGDRISLAACCPYGSDDVGALHELDELSRATHVPLVATNHVHYHDAARRALQDVLTCVRHGCTIREAGFKLFPNGERHLKSPRRMHRLFAGFPRAIRRGLEIAERCSFSLDELKYEYPDEVVPDGMTAAEHLADLTWAGAAERYPAGVPEKVRKQVDEELRLIAQLRIEHYFLTVHDVVRFARERDILCQGRGSAANSAVCYCLGITSVDPNVHDLLFARFISTARNEPPDIDVDFEHERREEVIQYVYGKYGRDRAGMTATVISYRGRSAVRDVGKAMGLSLDMVDSMAGKLDWWDRGVLSDVQLREVGLDLRRPDGAAGRAGSRRSLLGVPAAPQSAHGRAGDDEGAAVRNDPDRERVDAGPDGDRVGQGRHRRAGDPEGRHPGAGDADGVVEGAAVSE